MGATSKTSARTPVIAVTMGEPAGIGPEIVAKLFTTFRPQRSRAVIVGASRVLRPYMEGLGARLKGIEPGRERRWLAAARGPRVFFLDTGCGARYPRGRDSRGGGVHAAAALESACGLAKEGLVDGLVTAPLSKKSLHLAGCPFTGHTEMFARYFGAPDCEMVMVHGNFRVVPLTRHLALGRVGAALTADRIVRGLEAVHRALEEEFGVRAPRIAVAALNPHAGEGGLFGTEEIDAIGPAVRRARRRGIRVTGPVAADALFQEAESGTFDAFVAMYHDQGLIPFKMLAKRRGVNVTVGLPIVRTSVDHGVAYDIAGRGVAGIESIRRAYRLAEELARRRILRKSR